MQDVKIVDLCFEALSSCGSALYKASLEIIDSRFFLGGGGAWVTAAALSS